MRAANHDISEGIFVSEAYLKSLELSDKIAAVREKIAQAAFRAGRKPEEILLCAACKAQSSDIIRQSAAFDIDVFGENRMQEMAVHLHDNAFLGKPCHFIGHLQTNKVKNVVGQAELIHSAGSERLLSAISKEAQKQGIIQDVLIEVNLMGEESKAGIAPEELDALIDHAAGLNAVRMRGLMAIPPALAGEKETRGYFSRLRRLHEKLQACSYPNCLPDTLSMGMSDSFEWAVEEGATIVRVGRSIYGERV